MFILVVCEEINSSETIIVNISSTTVGSKATYQCRDGSTDVYTTQCTSHGVWDPHPLSSLDCTESTEPGCTVALHSERKTAVCCVSLS